MHSTYDEIDAEWEKLAAEAPVLPPKCKAVVTAFMQQEAGLAIRARCVHCGGLLQARDIELGLQGSARLIACPCGRSTNFWKVL